MSGVYLVSGSGKGTHTLEIQVLELELDNFRPNQHKCFIRNTDMSWGAVVAACWEQESAVAAAAMPQWLIFASIML